tara:strand:+ start:730 stop:1308 length:579 start_codon:yes stop_codon:yes gene_type:complete
MDDKDIIKTLSCNHRMHYKCYIKCVYYNKNLFIECPTCRCINIDDTKPFEDPKKNIEILCINENKRCRCITKDKKRCKNRSSLLNYGYCYQHNKGILEEKYYPLMVSYMYFILTQRNHFISRIYLFDIGKKLIMKYCSENTPLEMLIGYFHKYFVIKNIVYINDYKDIYKYYELEIPDSKWIEECMTKKVFY